MFIWQNTPLDQQKVQDFFASLKIHDLTHIENYYCQPTKKVDLGDRYLLYSGIIFENIEQRIAQLDINNIDVLHKQLQNLDANCCACLVTTNTVTIIRDLNGLQPIAYSVGQNLISVSSSPGLLIDLHNSYLLTPQNSIYTFSTQGKLLKRTTAYEYDYDTVSSVSQYLDVIEQTIEKIVTKNKCGVLLSSGIDCAPIEAVCLDRKLPVFAVASTVKGENLQILKQRYARRNNLKQKCPSKFLSSSPDNVDKVKGDIEKYLGLKITSLFEYSLGNFQLGEFLAKHNCNVALLGGSDRPTWIPGFFDRSAINHRFIWPEDMRLVMESSLAHIEVNMIEKHHVDVVPHLLHGINAINLYSDFNIIQTFVQLPALEKNSRKTIIGYEGLQGRAVDFQMQLCDRYNYPYHTNKKVGGPLV